MNNPLKITILQPIFSDYRKGVFDALSESVDLQILHSKNKTGVKQIKTSYSKEILCFKYSPIETNRIFFSFPEILKFKPNVFIHYLSIGVISLPFTYVICKLLKIRFVLWGHGVHRKNGFNPKNSLSDKVKLIYMKMADAVILYSESAKYVIKDYLNENKLFVAKNTLDTQTLTTIKHKLNEIGKSRIKYNLSLPCDHYLIYIGRLLTEKNPEILLDTVIRLRTKINKSIGVIYIGGGPELEKLKLRVVDDEISNIVFLGAVHDPEITGKYLYISDLMVMPGYLGLSVIQSLCFNTPVASLMKTKDGPFHSPEVENVINQKTGYLGKNITDLYDWIENFFLDRSLREQINTYIEQLQEEISLNKMIHGFHNCFNYLQTNTLNGKNYRTVKG